MAAPPTKPGKYCMLDPSPPMGTFNTARSNQVSMTLPEYIILVQSAYALAVL